MTPYSLNSRDLFLNLRRLVKMTKPLRFENKSLRLKYKCLICIWIIFWAILDLFINPKYLFQNKSFSQTYYFKSEKSFVILTSLLGLKINPGNLESINPRPPRQGEKGKGVKIEKKNRRKENYKREGGKLEMEVGKVIKSGEDFFFFFFFFLFAFHFWKRRKCVLGLPKWEFSTGKKHFTPWKKLGKMTFSPQNRGVGKARFNVATPTYEARTRPLHVQHTYYRIIFKQNPFNIISR